MKSWIRLQVALYYFCSKTDYQSYRLITSKRTSPNPLNPKKGFIVKMHQSYRSSEGLEKNKINFYDSNVVFRPQLRISCQGRKAAPMLYYVLRVIGESDGSL